MTKILIGTSNQAKINTYKRLLSDFGFEILSSKDLDIPTPQENAQSFEEEAVNKAKYYFKHSGIPTIVDDGGFQIETLNGEPGIRSRRWIGREMTDEEIIEEVFKRMEGKSERSCKHTTVVAIASPFGVFTSHGEVEGVVADKPHEKITPGYPYGSVMYLPNYNKYWRELLEESDLMSPRAHALSNLHDILKELKD